VGFNPFRQQDKTATDVVIVAVFIVIIVAVVVWAFVG
jgi:diacylglycerol kinase